MVEVLDGQALGRLVLPAIPVRGALPEETLVGGLRHPAGGVLDPFVGPAIEGDGTLGLAMAGLKEEHLLAVAEWDALGGDGDRGIELAGEASNLLKGAITDLLADELPVVANADRHAATNPVQEGAERLEGLLELGGRALELEGLAFSGGDELLELGGSHGTAILPVRGSTPNGFHEKNGTQGPEIHRLPGRRQGGPDVLGVADPGAAHRRPRSHPTRRLEGDR